MSRPDWKQDTPADQAVVLVGAARGWLDNLQEGASTLETAGPRLEALLEQLMELTQHHMLDEWDETEKL